AGAVIRYLQSRGIPGARMQAAGYADTRPLESNATAAGRSRNRRVEIIILRGAQSDAEFQGAASAVPDATPPGQPAEAPEAADPIAAAEAEAFDDSHLHAEDEAHSEHGGHC